VDRQFAELTKDYTALKQAYTEVKIRLTDLACKQNSSGQVQSEPQLKEKYDGLKYRHKVSQSCNQPSYAVHLPSGTTLPTGREMTATVCLYETVRLLTSKAANFMRLHYIWLQQNQVQFLRFLT